jgi:hypothetical protein
MTAAAVTTRQDRFFISTPMLPSLKCGKDNLATLHHTSPIGTKRHPVTASAMGGTSPHCARMVGKSLPFGSVKAVTKNILSSPPIALRGCHQLQLTDRPDGDNWLRLATCRVIIKPWTT